MSANMKVIKRDGSVVEYDRNKIVTAIQKANAEVSEEERLSQDRIEAIVRRIEDLGRDKLDEIGCTCPACGVVYQRNGVERQYINGKFVAATRNESPGFHLNALASLFVDWREIVEKFLTAKRREEKKATSNF